VPRTAGASAFTSSGSTSSRPWLAASTRAARIIACDARELAPIDSDGSLRVAWQRSTM
jgi:hypothetical protein